MTKTQKSELINKAILLIILAGVLSAILYLSNNTNLKVFRGETRSLTQDKEEDGQTLDCAKKIAQGEELLAGGDSDSCLFMGCGDFFSQ